MSLPDAARSHPADAPLPRVAEAVGFVGLLTVVTLVLKGYPVPYRDECVYMLSLFKAWHPSFLAGDWTFSKPWPEHFLFNVVFGLPTLVLPLEIAGWVFRAVSWIVIYGALLLFGGRLDLSPRLSALAAGLWLLFSQGNVAGGDWAIGEFQAKIVAHVALLLALAGFIRGRRILPALLLGIGFDFHPVVGLWGCLGAGVAMLVCRWPVAEIARIVFWTALAAAPGIASNTYFLLGDHGGILAAEDRRFYTLVAYPHLLDPLQFDKGEVVQAFVLFAFNLVFFASRRSDERLRFLAGFQIALAMFFIVGVALRLTGQVGLLNLYFFRLFAPYVHLFFFFNLMAVFRDRRRTPPSAALALIGLVGLLGFGSPVQQVYDQVRSVAVQWRARHDDCARAMRWLATNTPEDAVAVLPPWRPDSFFLSRRGQVASWLANRNDVLAEWKDRMESMVGPIPSRKPEQSWIDLLRGGYRRLTEDDLRSLRDRYGARYLVSDEPYGFPVLMDTGTWKVYGLGKS